MTQLISCTKNSDVNAYNAQVILKSTNTVYTVTAKDRVVGSTLHNMHQKKINISKAVMQKPVSYLVPLVLAYWISL